MSLEGRDLNGVETDNTTTAGELDRGLSSYKGIGTRQGTVELHRDRETTGDCRFTIGIRQRTAELRLHRFASGS